MNQQDKKIQLEDIKVNYSNDKVVDFNFEIDRLDLTSSVCLVTGENGSGKSTFLHILESKIPYRGKMSLICEGDHPKIFSFDTIELPDIKIDDFFKYHGLWKDKTSILREFSIDLGTRKTIKSLTPSEKNRLKLALVFVDEFDFILLDELSHDLSVGEAVAALKVLIANKKKAMLLVVDHRIQEDCGLFDHLLSFENGRIIRDVPLTGEEPTDEKMTIIPSTPIKKRYITTKHFAKSNMRFLAMIFIFISLINGAFLGSSLFINNKTDSIHPFIGLQSGYNTVDKGLLSNSDELHFSKDFFSLFEYPLEFKLPSNERRKIKLVSSFDQFGSTIIEGEKPKNRKEIAITKNLKRYVKNKKISIIPSKNGPHLTDMLVTGYLRGANSVSLSEFDYYLSSQAYPNFRDNTRVTLDGAILEDHASWAMDASLDEPKILVNSSIYDEFISKQHTVTISNTESGCQTTFNEIQIEKVDYHSDLPSIIVRFTFTEYMNLLRAPDSDSVTLLYDDYDSLNKDKDYLLESGFTIYSMPSIEKDLKSTYLALATSSLIYIALLVTAVEIATRHRYITLSGRAKGGNSMVYFSLLLATVILFTALILIKFLILPVMIFMSGTACLSYCGISLFRRKKHATK